MAAALGSWWHGVRVVSLPRGDHRVHTIGQALVSEVGPPRPSGDRDVNAARQRVKAHLSVPEVHQRPDIARLVSVDPHGVQSGSDQVVDVVRNVEEEDLGRPEQTLDVLAQAEHGRPPIGLVGADALEHTVAVVQRVGEHVNGGIVPVHKLTIHPDLGRLLDRHVEFFPSRSSVPEFGLRPVGQQWHRRWPRCPRRRWTGRHMPPQLGPQRLSRPRNRASWPRTIWRPWD